MIQYKPIYQNITHYPALPITDEWMWGHLDYNPYYRYRGRIVFANGCLDEKPLLMLCEFKNLNKSLWIHDKASDWITTNNQRALQDGCVYEFTLELHNHIFKIIESKLLFKVEI